MSVSEVVNPERLQPLQTPAHTSPQAEAINTVDSCMYLMGLPKLKYFLRYVRHHAIDEEPEQSLMADWQRAKEHFAEIQKSEAGAADNPATNTIDVEGRYKPLLVELLSDPLIRNGFNLVPTDVAFVDLDKLVVYQKHIDLSYVNTLIERLGPSPDDDQVFRMCLPFDHPHPPSRWKRIDEESYVFVSKSNDVRFLGAMPLEPENVQGYPHPGALLGVIGLAVGFGSNFLNAISVGNRLILHNGSHRAYALRALGYRQAPCLVQHASTRDELEQLAPDEVIRNSDFYLKHPRPSMLKDYFNPALRKIINVQRVLRQVKVRFSVSEYYTPVV